MRHNIPAALILEDDFDLQPDFAFLPEHQTAWHIAFVAVALNWELLLTRCSQAQHPHARATNYNPASPC